MNRIHPTAIIGDGVELGDDNVIGPYAIVLGPCRIGNGNWIGPHAVIGTPPEHRAVEPVAGWDGEQGEFGVVIGDKNWIREHVAVHQGTKAPTRIGDDCFLMVHSHIGHDVRLDDHVTLAPAAQVAGHNHVWSYANVGQSAAIHQQVPVGPGAMVGMAAVVRKEVRAFSITVGNPAKAVGLNMVGLSRMGCDDDAMRAISDFLGDGTELPAGVPAEVAGLLKAWADRA